MHAPQSAADAAAERQAQLVGGILLATFLAIAGAVFLGTRPARITLTTSTVTVRAAGYSSEIARADIDSVRLVSQLAGLGSKRNGFQAGSAYAGVFEMRPFGKVRLYVNTSRPPYLMVFSKQGVVLMNGHSAAETRHLYEQLTPSRQREPAP